MELLYGMDDGLGESLCVRVKGEVSEDGIVVGLCYRPHEQCEEVAEAFFKQLRKVLGPETLGFMGYFNLLMFSGRATMWDASSQRGFWMGSGIAIWQRYSTGQPGMTQS